MTSLGSIIKRKVGTMTGTESTATTGDQRPENDVETFEEWLIRTRVSSMNSAAETRKIAADSWGSGYDTGYSDALEHVAIQFFARENP